MRVGGGRRGGALQGAGRAQGELLHLRARGCFPAAESATLTEAAAAGGTAPRAGVASARVVAKLGLDLDDDVAVENAVEISATGKAGPELEPGDGARARLGRFGDLRVTFRLTGAMASRLTGQAAGRIEEGKLATYRSVTVLDICRVSIARVTSQHPSLMCENVITRRLQRLITRARARRPPGGRRRPAVQTFPRPLGGGVVAAQTPPRRPPGRTPPRGSGAQRAPPHLPERSALNAVSFSISSASAGSISLARRQTRATRQRKRAAFSSFLLRSRGRRFCLSFKSSRARASSSPRAASSGNALREARTSSSRLEANARPPRIGASRRARRVRRRAVGAPGARRAAALSEAAAGFVEQAFAAGSLRVFQKRCLRALSPRRASSRLPAGPGGSLAFARASRETRHSTFRAAARAVRNLRAFVLVRLRQPRRRRRRGDPSRHRVISERLSRSFPPVRARIPSYRNRHPAKCRVSPRSAAPIRGVLLYSFFSPVAVAAPRASRASHHLRKASSRASPSPSRRGVSRAFASEERTRARGFDLERRACLLGGDGAFSPPPPRRVRGDTCRVAPRGRVRRQRAARRGRRRDLPGMCAGALRSPRGPGRSRRAARFGGFRARRRFRFGVARPAAIRELGAPAEAETRPAAAAAAAAGTP